MNTFEAGVISAIPVGGIVGGIICKSYGIWAIIGGVIAGAIAGSLTGWAYALLIIGITSAFWGIWQGIRKLPDFDNGQNDQAIKSMIQSSNKGTILGVISGCVAGFLFGWWQGLLVALVIAIVTALVAVITLHLGIRKTLH
ncbi:MAG: hypothetical protein ACYSWP_21905 [Planctomycetota bacterium]|jgi:asparagine N-glycosylation enzyme membrane subunit Stt3